MRPTGRKNMAQLIRKAEGDPNMLEIWDKQLSELTHSRPVALTFSDICPEGLARDMAPQPSGCAFWKLAAEGKAFYTETKDHFGCMLGAYTLGAELTEAQQQDLRGFVPPMLNLSYLKLQGPRGNEKQVMLLTEAGTAAGFPINSGSMGRPACGIVPESVASGRVVLSLACIGNRVYTSLGDHEGYIAIPGPALEVFCDKLTTVVKANEELAAFHGRRQNQFAVTA